MNAYGYMRVSSKGQNLALQEHAIEEEARRRGDEIVGWYSEKMSAKTSQRPELDRLRADIRAGRVQGRVYGFRLDRFLRTGPADAFRFAEECHTAGVELVTVADGLNLKPGKDDITTAVLLFAFSLAAKLERAAIADRIAAARVHMEAEGRRWGRPPRMTFHERSEAVARRDAGESVRSIARAMRVPRPTIARLLARNPPLVAVPRSGPKPRGEWGEAR